MLVIISDLHLTDGTVGNSLPTGAFQIFAERLRDMTISASFRADGTYRPLESVDLLLLGDILDIIRSSQWLTSDVRPWSSTQLPALAQRVGQISNQVIANNAAGLEILRGLATQNLLRIPPADRAGQPVYQAPGQAVAVRIHYLVGNHDWFLHVPGQNFDPLRNQVIERLGLNQSPNTPLIHDPNEGGPIIEVLRRHKVFARHGDIFDPFNYEGDRCRSSLGDAIVVELLNKFPIEVAAQLGADVPEGLVLGLRELDNVRPTLLAPVWIDGLLERTSTLPAARNQVKQIWDRLVDQFLNLDFVRNHDSWRPFDMVSNLERILKFSKRLSIGWSTAIIEFWQSLRGRDEASYYPHALAEQDFRNRRAKHIIYGHTHLAEYVPLDASHAEGYVLNQGYFNSGTWRRVHRSTQFSPAEHEFIPADSMTYLAFFQGDERSGRPFETWTGTLGINALETPQYRIDPSHASAAVAAGS
ncbi:MAG TPA: hypothetical protein VFE24_09745, partial [Pirellulales bacterium]|nr:hypothetical protein [Pirellulales bacterium]